MTPVQKTKLKALSLAADTANFADLRAAIGAEILFLNSIQEAWLFIRAFRIAQANCPDQPGDEINIMLSEALRSELNLLSRGADMIDKFVTWFAKSQEQN